jgi:hypothetical protein
VRVVFIARCLWMDRPADKFTTGVMVVNHLT